MSAGKSKHISRSAKKNMATAGLANLTRWRAGQEAETAEVRAMTTAFETELRAEIGGNTSAIASGLALSAVASYSTIVLVSLKISKGLGRIDRVKELHSLLVEAQRVLHRNLKALTAWKESPEARDAAMRRITATVPALTPEDTAAKIKSEVEAAKKKFSWIESGGKPDAEE
jgi:hypothetical protein